MLMSAIDPRRVVSRSLKAENMERIAARKWRILSQNAPLDLINNEKNENKICVRIRAYVY